MGIETGANTLKNSDHETRQPFADGVSRYQVQIADLLDEKNLGDPRSDFDGISAVLNARSMTVGDDRTIFDTALGGVIRDRKQTPQIVASAILIANAEDIAGDPVWKSVQSLRRRKHLPSVVRREVDNYIGGRQLRKTFANKAS